MIRRGCVSLETMWEGIIQFQTQIALENFLKPVKLNFTIVRNSNAISTLNLPSKLQLISDKVKLKFHRNKTQKILINNALEMMSIRC